MSGETQNSANEAAGSRKVDLAIAFGIVLGIAFAVGATYIGLGGLEDNEVEKLVKLMMPASRSLCAAATTSSATILALMLTLIGLTVSADVKFNNGFYKRLKQ